MSDFILKANSNIAFNIKFLGYNIPITDSIVSMWIVMGIIILIALISSRNLKFLPNAKQNLAEIFIDFIKGIISNAFDRDAQKFVPFIGTMFIFLVVANIIDIINIIIPNLNIVPPTKDINIVIAFSIISIFSVIYAGIKYRKFSGWLKSFIEPVPIILPFKILDYFIKPISLTLRLFGNIMAGFLIMLLLYSMVPAILPSFASMYFDLFDGILQAYIFVFLTSLYIGEAIEED